MNKGEKRALNPEFKKWIFTELNKRITQRTRRKNPKWVMIVAALILADKKINESGGNNRGKWVEYLQDTIGVPYGEAWCMSTMQTLVAIAEEYTGVKSYLASVDFYGSEHCLTVFRNSPLLQVSVPSRGVMTIYQYGSTENGHTGLILGVTGKNLLQAEGNTGPGSGEIERDGDGFYIKKRTTDGYGTAKIKGYLDPFPEYSVDQLAA